MPKEFEESQRFWKSRSPRSQLRLGHVEERTSFYFQHFLFMDDCLLENIYKSDPNIVVIKIGQINLIFGECSNYRISVGGPMSWTHW